MRSPRSTTLEKSRTSTRPPSATLAFSASITLRPELPASAALRRTLPVATRRSARARRIASSARTRPSLRVRRALIPCRIQTSSCASFLSNNAWACASAWARSSRRRK